VAATSTIRRKTFVPTSARVSAHSGHQQMDTSFSVLAESGATRAVFPVRAAQTAASARSSIAAHRIHLPSSIFRFAGHCTTAFRSRANHTRD
jgi:hypothetical protein